MNTEATPETTLRKTLHLLVRRLGLSPDEVAQLRLSHLHLAGKNPNISFTPAGSKTLKTVDLDLESHRALVGWLVSRPDSVGDFLFPGSGAEAMGSQEIEQAVKAAESDRGVIAGEAGEETETKSERPGLDEIKPTPGAGRPSGGEATMVSGSSRPMPPPSRPEMGTPPRPLGNTLVSRFRPPPPPPATVPEVDESVNIPLPSVMPKPPPAPPPESELDTPEAVGPIEKELAEAPAPGPTAAPTEQKEAETESGKESPADRPPVAEERRVEPPPVAKEPQVASRPVAKERPVERSARPQEKEARPASRPIPPQKRRKSAAEQAARQPQPDARRSSSRLLRVILPVAAIVVILGCVVCVGGGGWFLWQSETGSELLAGLGLPGAIPEEEIIEAGGDTEATPDTVGFQSPISPPPTPTLPPTTTPTALPPTNTPLPTETATPLPTDTPVPPPTDTPIPTDTPLPTDTPPPTEPTDTPTPAETPTPAMKYEAPVLLEPEDNFAFIQGNTIVLRWEPVDELAPDEQYAVRLVYPYEGKLTYQGTQVKESEWTVPLSLFGQIDPPENRYEWFIVVERLNDDGSGTAISPESERRTFTWK